MTFASNNLLTYLPTRQTDHKCPLNKQEVVSLLSPETEKECENVKMFLNEQKRIFHWCSQKEKILKKLNATE